MKKFEFKKIRGTIESLISSTSLRLRFGGVEVRLDRRNSPYISRQEVEYSSCNKNNYLFLRNNVSGIVISHEPIRNPQVELGDFSVEGNDTLYQWREFYIPSALLAPLLEQVNEYIPLQSFGEERLLWVYVPIEVLSHFDGSGRPVFKKRNE